MRGTGLSPCPSSSFNLDSCTRARVHHDSTAGLIPDTPIRCYLSRALRVNFLALCFSPETLNRFSRFCFLCAANPPKSRAPPKPFRNPKLFDVLRHHRHLHRIHAAKFYAVTPSSSEDHQAATVVFFLKAGRRSTHRSTSPVSLACHLLCASPCVPRCPHPIPHLLVLFPPPKCHRRSSSPSLVIIFLPSFWSTSIHPELCIILPLPSPTLCFPSFPSGATQRRSRHSHELPCRQSRRRRRTAAVLTAPPPPRAPPCPRVSVLLFIRHSIAAGRRRHRAQDAPARAPLSLSVSLSIDVASHLVSHLSAT